MSRNVKRARLLVNMEFVDAVANALNRYDWDVIFTENNYADEEVNNMSIVEIAIESYIYDGHYDSGYKLTLQKAFMDYGCTDKSLAMDVADYIVSDHRIRTFMYRNFRHVNKLVDTIRSVRFNWYDNSLEVDISYEV